MGGYKFSNDRNDGEKNFEQKEAKRVYRDATFIYCYIRFVALLFLEHFFFRMNKIIRNVFGALLLCDVIVEKLADSFYS